MQVSIAPRLPIDQSQMGCGASKAPPSGSIDNLTAATSPSHQPAAVVAPPPKYSADAPVPLSAAEVEEPADPGDDVTAAAGSGGVVHLEFGGAASGGGARSRIVRSEWGSGIGYSVQQQTKSSVAALQGVDLGALHKALDGAEPVTLPRLQAAVQQLLPAGEAPPAEVFSALFRAWDVDGSGSVDKGELMAGCQALCSGDQTEKLKLTFKCFDSDGDGHLSKPEVQLLLRGSIASAVRMLHAGLEFAGSDASIEELKEEATSAGATLEQQADGMVKVGLTTPVGPVTIHVPVLALKDCNTAELSADAFLEALVNDAFAQHDADGNATIEMDEFVAFVKSNDFLSAWFGFLQQEPSKVDYEGKTSWKDAHLA